jgi:two-component system sensor histidine kinase/response regulator
LDERDAMSRLEDNTELYREILSMFLEEAQSYIKEVDYTYQKKEYDKTRFMAHALKGMAGNIGAIALQDLCQQLQQSPDYEIDQLAKRLLSLWEDTKMAIENWLQSQQ